jgi:PadR family transcriptional regulator, regulatory protein PadR
MNFKGTLPALILEALVREPSHGYRIAQGIKERSKGVLDFKEGTLYPALHKLENEGLVQSYEEVENGRLRRYYRITKSGRAVLAKDRAEWRELSRAVTVILEGCGLATHCSAPGSACPQEHPARMVSE